MLKLFNDFGEVSAQGGYSNPVHFDFDARFDEEFVQPLILRCTEGYVAQNVTLTDTGDTADRYFFSVNGTSWADSAEFATITDNATCYIKARTTENETAATLRDAKLLLTYEIEPAATPNFYYTNPGDADLLAVEDATTVTTTAAQSVTGKAFINYVADDLFNSPTDLKEVWMRFDVFPPRSNMAAWKFHAGNLTSTGSSIVGMYYYNLDGVCHLCDGSKDRGKLYPIIDCKNSALVHIKSGATDGIVEFTLNDTTVSWTGNIIDGGDIERLVMYSRSGYEVLFSNVVVSSGEIDSACGWHRDLFSLETHITAPVLNVRWQGENHQFKPSTKRTKPAFTVRVGDRNFYAPIVNENDALASAVRLLLDDTNRALTT